MEFDTWSHRHAMALFKWEEPYKQLWEEVSDSLSAIDDDSLALHFETHYSARQKSLSNSINDLIREQLMQRGWAAESPIFADQNFLPGEKGRFRLDFAKRLTRPDGSEGGVSIEVAFNHGEAAAWNLLKPVLASELNHVSKAIQSDVGILIAATEQLKVAGGFDSAVGTFEKYVQYLRPLSSIISVPMVIIGLRAPKTFEIVHYSQDGKKRGRVRRLPG